MKEAACAETSSERGASAVATQGAEVDATTQHNDGDKQRRKELPLGLTEPGHLLQDLVDNCHKPCTG